MSGQPNIEQITELRQHVQRMTQAKRDIADCRLRIKQDTETLKAAEIWFNDSKQRIVDLMDKMDVKSSHNMGWENRFMMFLSELVFPSLKNESEDE